jgi:hypothetical protein
MELAVYEKLWACCIKPQIDRMLSADADIIFTEGQVKEKIGLTYEDYKNRVHTFMRDPDGRIDRHKVASVMLYSIIINKPLEVRVLPASREVNSTALLSAVMNQIYIKCFIIQKLIIAMTYSRSRTFCF